jgi:hypothetical protein
LEEWVDIVWEVDAVVDMLLAEEVIESPAGVIEDLGRDGVVGLGRGADLLSGVGDAPEQRGVVEDGNVSVEVDELRTASGDGLDGLAPADGLVVRVRSRDNEVFDQRDVDVVIFFKSVVYCSNDDSSWVVGEVLWGELGLDDGNNRGVVEQIPHEGSFNVADVIHRREYIIEKILFLRIKIHN